MSKPRTIKEPIKKLVTVETESYEQLYYHGVKNFSQWVRERIDEYITVENDLNTLEQLLTEKEQEKTEIEIEIANIKDKIKEIKETQKANENNAEIQKSMLETIINVSNNEFNGAGITQERLNIINNARLTQNTMKKLLKKHDIKIISSVEVTNSTIIKAGEKTKKEKHHKRLKHDDNQMDKMKQKFTRELNRYNMNNVFSKISAKEFLKMNSEKYHKKCENAGVSYDEFQKIVLS